MYTHYFGQMSLHVDKIAAESMLLFSTSNVDSVLLFLSMVIIITLLYHNKASKQHTRIYLFLSNSCATVR